MQGIADRTPRDDLEAAERRQEAGSEIRMNDSDLVEHLRKGRLEAARIGILAAKLREKVAPRKLRELGNLLVEIIGEVMDRSVVTIPESMTVAELAGEIAAGNPALVGRQGIPIVDAQGALAGIIARSDLMRALEDDQGRGTSVLDAGTRNLIVAFPTSSCETRSGGCSETTSAGGRSSIATTLGGWSVIWAGPGSCAPGSSCTRRRICASAARAAIRRPADPAARRDPRGDQGHSRRAVRPHRHHE